MFLIYDLIFLCIALVYVPVYLLRGKISRGLIQRLGIIPGRISLSRPVWVHAVSVGEAMAVRGLCDELRKILPGGKIVISTVTAKGNKIAQGIAGEGDLVIYLPFDFSFSVNAVMKKVDPRAFIIAETEIWPNLITCLYKRKVPVAVVNGRISDASYKGYLAVKFLLGPVLKRVRLFCVQTESDKERLIQLGVGQDKIRVTGNMKFDAADYARRISASDCIKYKAMLGLQQGEKLLVSGSTHQGEEEAVIRAYKKLKAEFPALRLLLAPRHPERCNEVEKLVANYGLKCARVSSLDKQPNSSKVRDTVFLLDTIGQLLYFYAVCEMAFVGGSLVKKGGQNILEPASFAKPVLFGPFMFNFRDIADLFLKNKAGILVGNEAQLETGLRYLLQNPAEASALGCLALGLIKNNQGATAKNADLLRETITAAG